MLAVHGCFGFGAFLQFFLDNALNLFGENRLLLPEERLLEQIPGGDAEVFGGAQEGIPVGQGAHAAFGEEIALQGDVLGVPSPVSA